MKNMDSTLFRLMTDIVVMDYDHAMNTAVRTITENVPDVRVVEYGSLEYVLTISRTVWKSRVALSRLRDRDSG